MKTLVSIIFSLISLAVMSQDIDTVRVKKTFRVFENNDCHRLLAIREYEAYSNDYVYDIISYAGERDSTNYKSNSYDAWTVLFRKNCTNTDRINFVKFFPYKFEYHREYRESRVFYSLDNKNPVVKLNKGKWNDLNNSDYRDSFNKLLYYKLYKELNPCFKSRCFEQERRFWLLNSHNVDGISDNDIEFFEEFFKPSDVKVESGSIAEKELATDEEMAGFEYEKLNTPENNFALSRDYQRDDDFYYKKDGTFTKKPIWTIKHEHEIDGLKMPENFCVRLIYAYKLVTKEALGTPEYATVSDDAFNTYYAKYIQLIDEGRCEGTELEQSRVTKYIEE